MVIKIYKMYNRPEVANKELYGEIVTDTNGYLTLDTSAKNPIIDISGYDIDALAGYNYCYIPKFKRYYYVEQEFMTSGLIRLHMTTDLLTTAYHTPLASNPNKTLFQDDRWAYLERSETNFNAYYHDPERYAQLAYKHPKVYKFSDPVCSDDAAHYYIQVTGGGS